MTTRFDLRNEWASYSNGEGPVYYRKYGLDAETGPRIQISCTPKCYCTPDEFELCKESHRSYWTHKRIYVCGNCECKDRWECRAHSEYHREDYRPNWSCNQDKYQLKDLACSMLNNFIRDSKDKLKRIESRKESTLESIEKNLRAGKIDRAAACNGLDALHYTLKDMRKERIRDPKRYYPISWNVLAAWGLLWKTMSDEEKQYAMTFMREMELKKSFDSIVAEVTWHTSMMLQSRSSCR